VTVFSAGSRLADVVEQALRRRAAPTRSVATAERRMFERDVLEFIVWAVEDIMGTGGLRAACGTT